jgi:hypothetical protein
VPTNLEIRSASSDILGRSHLELGSPEPLSFLPSLSELAKTRNLQGYGRKSQKDPPPCTLQRFCEAREVAIAVTMVVAAATATGPRRATCSPMAAEAVAISPNLWNGGVLNL